MDRTAVFVRSGLVKGERKSVVRGEYLRFEGFVPACDRVLNVVAIHPRHRCCRRNRDLMRNEAEVIDLDLDLLRSRLPTRAVVAHCCLMITSAIFLVHLNRPQSGRYKPVSLDHLRH